MLLAGAMARNAAIEGGEAALAVSEYSLRNSARTPFGMTSRAFAMRPRVSAMRPASIGVAPPPWEKIHRMSGFLARVPLISRLVMARVESNGYSIACGRRPGMTLPQHAAEVG